jgi:hypothetical protein
VSFVRMQEIRLKLWLNDEADWSIEINGHRHEHVTSEIMEGLVEATLVSAQSVMTNTATRNRRCDGVMSGSKNVPKKAKILEFVVPHEAIEIDLERWLRRVLESNDVLVAALERIRGSYKSMMAGRSVTDAAEILAAVETALKNAERAKNVV